MSDLKGLFEERSAARSFKMRNAAYRLFEATYNSEDIDHPVMDLAYRPNNVDGVQIGQDSDIRKIVINQVRRVVAHFGAMFSHRPRIFVMPVQENDEARVQREADYIEYVLGSSNMDALHAQQSHFLSLRGDAVFAVDWNPVEGAVPRVQVKVYDPRNCYPLFNPDDLGGVEDMLIAQKVHPAWAEHTFSLPKGVVNPGQMANVYYYWTATEASVQVEDFLVHGHHRQHDLGFCPFRWVFGDPSGLMAQADCREVPKLQEVFNEALLLTIDAVRKQVDPAWYVTGVPKDVTPEPGVANALPENASVGRWPIEADPSIIMQVMSSLEQAIYTTTGVSPISMQGQARGSIVTGPAVRHQVEAADARAEMRKVLLESAYSRLGEMILKVANLKYPEELVTWVGQTGAVQMQGKNFNRQAICGAVYSDFVSQTVEQRFQIAMQGLGRLWDDSYAITNIMNLPGTNAKDMLARIRHYQITQAGISAEAQVLAQKISQEAQGGQPGQQQGQPGQQPQPQTAKRPVPMGGQPPTGPGLRSALAKMSGAANGTGRA